MPRFYSDSDLRNYSVSLSFSEEEKKKFEKAAKLKGRSLSDWIRLACYHFGRCLACDGTGKSHVKFVTCPACSGEGF